MEPFISDLLLRSFQKAKISNDEKISFRFVVDYFGASQAVPRRDQESQP